MVVVCFSCGVGKHIGFSYLGTLEYRSHSQSCSVRTPALLTRRCKGRFFALKASAQSRAERSDPSSRASPSTLASNPSFSFDRSVFRLSTHCGTANASCNHPQETLSHETRCKQHICTAYSKSKATHASYYMFYFAASEV